MNKFMQMPLEAVGRTSNGIEEHYATSHSQSNRQKAWMGFTKPHP
jgi:hypothetical protein